MKKVSDGKEEGRQWALCRIIGENFTRILTDGVGSETRVVSLKVEKDITSVRGVLKVHVRNAETLKRTLCTGMYATRDLMKFVC